MQPGDVVAIVGAGPIGLSAIMGSRLYSPAHVVAIDLADTRLEAAKQFGADVVVNNGREDPRGGRATTSPTAWARTSPSRRSAFPRPSSSRPRSVRPGGHVANIGVHGEPATLHLEDLWIRDVTITTGLVDTYSTPTLAPAARSGHQLDAGASSPTTSHSTSSWTRTTSSPAPARPARSKSYWHAERETEVTMQLKEVHVQALPLERLSSLIGPARMQRFAKAAQASRDASRAVPS